MQAAAIKLTQLDDQVTRLTNIIFEKKRPIRFSLGDRRFCLEFIPDSGRVSGVELTVKIDTHSYTICLPDMVPVSWFSELPDDEQLAQLPPALQCAALESGLEDLLDRFEHTTGTQAELTAYHLTDTPCTPEKLPAARVDFQLTREDAAYRCSGRISCSLLALENLVRWVAAVPSQTTLSPGLPVQLRFIAGSTGLTYTDVMALEPNDIILMDTADILAQRLSIRLSPSLAFTAKVNSEGLATITGIAEEHVTQDNWQDNQEQTPDDHAEAPLKIPETAMKDISMELTFQVGSATLPLGEVSGLQPGYTFNLGRELEKPVAIVINGAVIGHGELVQIDGRLGVRIKEIAEHAAG